MIFGAIRKYLDEILRELLGQKECQTCVYIFISILPKHLVSYAIDYIKGKSAISIARRFVGKTKNFIRREFLGTRIFCDHDWTRRRDGQGIRQKSRPRSCPL